MVAASKRYEKTCPDCGTLQTYGRKDHYMSAVRGNWRCKKCSNSDPGNNQFAGKYEDIPVTWFEVKKRGGMSRGYQWDLSIEDVWEMYVHQDRKCALSNREIGWPERGITATVSIDRIDSSEGYVYGNVQLVHKDVNFMKQQFSQDYFIEMCKDIASNADRVKW